VRLVIPGHASTYRIAMHEYYITLYPLSFLIAASIRRPLDAVVLAAHVTLFPRTLAGMARHIGRALRQRLSASRALVAER
jgi:hypothetical protein